MAESVAVERVLVRVGWGLVRLVPREGRAAVAWVECRLWLIVRCYWWSLLVNLARW